MVLSDKATGLSGRSLKAMQRNIFQFALMAAVASLVVCGTSRAQSKSPALKAAKSVKEEAAAPDFGVPQVKEINKEIRQVWTDNNLTPSPPALDHEWCRRVYLDVLGRIPSVQELREFVLSKETDKKAKLVSKLLYDDKHTEEYARIWTNKWTNILIGRNGGTERNSLTSRPGMQKYLRDCFARNKPYDKMVYELVTATGQTAPGAEG